MNYLKGREGCVEGLADRSLGTVSVFRPQKWNQQHLSITLDAQDCVILAFTRILFEPYLVSMENPLEAAQCIRFEKCCFLGNGW